MSQLQAWARALGGDVCGGSVSCPGPGHSRNDRSLSVTPCAAAPDDFLVFSHAGDDFAACRDHVRARLGLPQDWKRAPTARPAAPARHPVQPPPDDDDGRVRAALAIWNSAVDLRRTDGGLYLRRDRQLKTSEDFSAFLRWHAPSRALIGLFRDVETNEPRAITRIYIDAEGHKIGRKFLGPVGGCAIKLDCDEAVTTSLHISEGLESGLAARQLGFRPTWVLGSAGAIGRFPVLNGIEVLSILRETDDSGANELNAILCAELWTAMGAEVLFVEPLFRGDLNDVLKRAS
jgi:putative DNA primase/helicase